MASRPDTKTVTVRRVAPKPRQERLTDRRAFVPKTGSLGLSGDLQRLVNSGCFGPDPVVGHAVVVDREVFDRVADTGPGWDQGFGRQVDGLTRWWSTFDPKCSDCRKAARVMLNDRGVSDEQIRRLFDLVGARWTWTTPEKRQARQNSEAGEVVIDGPGRITTDSAVRVREANRARKILADDLAHDSKVRQQRAAAARKQRSA